MTDCFALINDLRLRLVVRSPRAAISVRAAGVEHELSETQVILIAGNSVQLHQAHFGDLVPRPDFPLSRAKGMIEQFRAFQRDIEQRSLSCRLIMRDGGLV